MAKPKYEEWLTDDGLLRISGWARDGLTYQQIADNMRINVTTLRDWRKAYPSIDSALKESADIADRHVENALYKRALGYTYDEVTQELRLNKETGEELFVETRRVTKQVLPDVTAQIYWLKNRKPKDWRDKREDDTVDKTINITIGGAEDYAD